MRVRTLAITALLLAATASAQLPRTPSAPGTEVYIQDPQDGATVPTTFTVRFGLRGMGVAPAGIDHPNTGHHHLLINTELPSSDLPLPTTDSIRHFGAGQTETELELPPGEHTLQLVLGDYLHIPHDPIVMSEVIRITVADGDN